MGRPSGLTIVIYLAKLIYLLLGRILLKKKKYGALTVPD